MAALSSMRLGNPERMRLRIEDIIIQTNELWLGEDEVEVLERLGQPEALISNSQL
jgi:hypothetical protein